MITGLMRNLLPRLIALACLGMALCSPPGARAQGQGRGREPSLQSFVVALMQGQRGAAIVTNPRMGKVLAVSNPRIAFDRVFPPGSTAKLVVSAAALEEGLITPQDRILCRGVPAWFMEGMVESLSGERLPVLRGALPAGENLEKAFSSPRTGAEMRYAYAVALDSVKRLVREQGQAVLWRVLERPTADGLRWIGGKKRY